MPAKVMHWIAPTEEDTDNTALKKRLWTAAGQFHANSDSSPRTAPRFSSVSTSTATTITRATPLDDPLSPCQNARVVVAEVCKKLHCGLETALTR